MNDQIKEKLHRIWFECDENNNSTEFMLQYMQDSTGLSYEKVLEFVLETMKEERIIWAKKLYQNEQ